MRKTITRRQFGKSGAVAAAGLAAASAARVLGANERIRLGFIGVGNRGGQVLDAFLKHKDAEPAIFCDVFAPFLERAKKQAGGQGETCKDFRQVLERKDIDAVVIATPDHWHAIQAVDACDAKKDAYVEKPLCITIKEGRRMVEAARRNQRIVQVGTQRRSSKLYAQLLDLIKAGTVGKITVARAYRLSNMWPKGIGKLPPSDPPKDLDWDLWLGPRPARPYQDNIAPYKFRWWDLYSSQTANWGIHYFDALRWLTGDLAPAAVVALGGRFAVDDDRTIPDTMESIFELPSGRLFVFGQYEATQNPTICTARKDVTSAEAELRGTLGTVYIQWSRAFILPERGGQFQTSEPRCKEELITVSEPDPTIAHARDFLDCIRSRQTPRADVEIGHRSTTFSILANIALAAKARIEWDAERETITSPTEANSLLHYEYRKPWVLK